MPTGGAPPNACIREYSKLQRSSSDQRSPHAPGGASYWGESARPSPRRTVNGDPATMALSTQQQEHRRVQNPRSSAPNLTLLSDEVAQGRYAAFGGVGLLSSDNIPNDAFYAAGSVTQGSSASSSDNVAGVQLPPLLPSRVHKRWTIDGTARPRPAGHSLFMDATDEFERLPPGGGAGSVDGRRASGRVLDGADAGGRTVFPSVRSSGSIVTVMGAPALVAAAAAATAAAHRGSAAAYCTTGDAAAALLDSARALHQASAELTARAMGAAYGSAGLAQRRGYAAPSAAYSSQQPSAGFGAVAPGNAEGSGSGSRRAVSETGDGGAALSDYGSWQSVLQGPSTPLSQRPSLAVSPFAGASAAAYTRSPAPTSSTPSVGAPSMLPQLPSPQRSTADHVSDFPASPIACDSPKGGRLFHAQHPSPQQQQQQQPHQQQQAGHFTGSFGPSPEAQPLLSWKLPVDASRRRAPPPPNALRSSRGGPLFAVTEEDAPH